MSDAPDELERLKHDIAMYVEISAQQATEIAHLRLVMKACVEAIGDDNDEFGALRMLEVALER